MKGKMQWHGQDLTFDLDQRLLVLDDSREKKAMIFMPGIGLGVMIRLSGDEPVWKWNGDVYHPTISPSIRTVVPNRGGKEVTNHVAVKNGVIEYLEDCTHEYSGLTMALPKLIEWPMGLWLWRAFDP